MLADADAGNVGGDRFELATNLSRSVHLQIIHVLMRRTAGQVDHDDGLRRLAFAGLLLRLEELG